MITPADLQWWLDLAPTLPWTEAKTMPDAPHSYVVRGRTMNSEDFLRAVKVIRTFGEPGKFYSRTNIYLTDEATKWWTMGDTLDGTIIINQASVDQVYGSQTAPQTRSGIHNEHDLIACDYDARYQSEEAHRENAAMVAIARQYFGAYAPKTLDAGCGTGLLLDLGATAPGMYTGVDPSQGMLNELIRKHPRVKDIRAALMEDVIEDFAPRSYEFVASWFGSASHLPGDTIMRLAEVSSGLTMFMCYVPGYLPDYYTEAPSTLDESREACRELLGEHFTLNQFEVVVIRD